MQVFGVDVGGSGVKGAPVYLGTGSLAAERLRIPTPKPSTPDAVSDAIAQIIESHRWDGPVGVAIPGVVRSGIVETAANIDGGWIGLDAAAMLTERLQMPVTVLNDADAAGLAEAQHGAAKGAGGVVILLTFGTGIGSAYLYDGRLIPNTELGHLIFKGQKAEHYAAGRLVKRLVSEPMPAGHHDAVWEGRDSAGRAAAAGVYFFRLKTGDIVDTKRMTLIK